MTKPLTEKQRQDKIEKALKKFHGDFNDFARAVGMLYVGELMGWRVLVLIHDKKTIAKYEQILDIKIQEIFPPVGKYAYKSIAWKLVQKVTNFWKAVKGEIPGIRTPEIER
jgi:hypothetical protein